MLCFVGWGHGKFHTYPLFHVGTLLVGRRLVPVNVGLARPPDLLASLAGEEADDTEQDDEEEPADYGNGLGSWGKRGVGVEGN